MCYKLSKKITQKELLTQSVLELIYLFNFIDYFSIIATYMLIFLCMINVKKQFTDIHFYIII